MATDVVQEAWQNLESSQHLLHHAKGHEGDDSSESNRERVAILKLYQSLEAWSLLSIKTPGQD